ncbi:WD domain-containing protein [Histoplasma capsulatum G186AR]|nr:WD domain-containing protein [Histoplasma capsulatum]QSS67038.1 WD domain-containing protein [Histoplasma capsulatum G186AR]
MAWQPSSAMAGNGGMSGGVHGAAIHMSHVQGTEYTLQGVMRFLQTQWHRHERDRNAWEIERAEMKSRIARLEGDARTSKRMYETLSKHVKMLEAALKREREKVKSLSTGEAVDTSKNSKDLAKDDPKSLPQQQPKSDACQVDLDNRTQNASNPDVRQDSEREKSRVYLGKCSQEVTYHIIPGSRPPPDLLDLQEMSDHGYQNHQMQRPSFEDVYVQHQYQHQQRQKIHQQQHQQQHNHVNMVREPAVHQPITPNYSENFPAGPRALNPSHQNPLEAQPFEQQRSHPIPMDRRKESFDHPPVGHEEVESITHTFDEYGNLVSISDLPKPITSIEPEADDADGWNFDETPVDITTTSSGPHHRPDTDVFPNADFVFPKSSPRGGPGSHRRKGSGRRRADGTTDSRDLGTLGGLKVDVPNFKVRFALRGHLDVVRSVIFTGGGSPSEPEICTCGDDGTIKRWIIPASYGNIGPNSSDSNNDLDITSYFTHRGHLGPVTCLAACPPAPNFSSGGRALGDGWVFSGGQDGSVKVWERGRVDPKASLDTHTDSVWALRVLPGTAGSIFGDRCSHYGGPDRIVLVSGASDGRLLIWAVSAPPQLASPQAGNRRVGGSRRANSISSGSNFPSSPQPSTASATPFHYTLIHHIIRPDSPSSTSISPLSLAGVNFVVSYADASIIVYDTRSGEEVVGMASLETYDGTRATGVNSVVASTVGFDGTANLDPNRTLTEEEAIVHGATGTSGGVEGVIISGYEDRYIRFFDANSGQCTYTMLAHPTAISSLALSPDGRELVSAGHDASLRFWSLEKRSCVQEITSHRLLRGEGVCAVVWSQDGRWVVSGGGDGVVKVFSR